MPEEKLHLHELGGADTLVDVVGAFWLLHSLEVSQVYASPLPAPRGRKGDMTLPAPASLRVLEGTGVDMADLAGYLTGKADRPVRDNTGLQGVFDIKMQWNPFSTPTPADDTPRSPAAEKREGPRPDFASLSTLDTALERQLGLKLVARKGPVDIYVVDHVERPSEN